MQVIDFWQIMISFFCSRYTLLPWTCLTCTTTLATHRAAVQRCGSRWQKLKDFNLDSLPLYLLLVNDEGFNIFAFGSQAFVSEYAVNSTDANTGNLLAALGEAGFLLGLEKNRFLFKFEQRFIFLQGLDHSNRAKCSYSYCHVFVAVTL